MAPKNLARLSAALFQSRSIYGANLRDNLLAPGALLTLGRGDYQGLVVGLGGVIVDRGGGLRAEVASLGVEIERADAVGTARADKLHATFDALESIGFHCLNCSPFLSGGEDAMVRRRK